MIGTVSTWSSIGPVGDVAAILALGRIVRRKGSTMASMRQKLASFPLLIAGEVYPYLSHQQYFAEED